MTHQALARKWRPRQFSEIVGQPTLIKSLTQSLSKQHLHHAYLFTGTRGVGKTTIGRLLAMALNCEKGITATPCGQCAACQSIIQGNFADLIEVDAASKTKVEDTRDLLAQVPYLPTVGRYKIYLIDEIHMFSNHSFNALLKTLEEPPSHVIFILATTDPEKLPKTILSRCLHFPLQTIPESLISQQLGHILEQEKIQFDAAALTLVAKAANGSLRDALSLLEPMLSDPDCGLTQDLVVAHLGWCPEQYAFDLITAILKEEAASALKVVEEALKQGFDPANVLVQVLHGLHQISLILALNGKGSLTTDQQFWQPLAAQTTQSAVQLYYQLGLMARRDFAYAVTPQQGLEMALLRMIAFQPQAWTERTVTATTTTTRIPERTVQTTAHPVRSEGALPDLKSTPAVTPMRTPASAPPAVPHAPVLVAPSTTSLDWPATVARLSLGGMAKLLVENCVLHSFQGDVLCLRLDESKQVFYQKDREQAILEALEKLLGKKITLKIQVGTVTTPTPTFLQQQAKESKQKAATESIEADPTVQAMLDSFSAQVVKIEPLSNQ